MPLDLAETAAQIDRMALSLASRRSGRHVALDRLISALTSLDPVLYESWREELSSSENGVTVRFMEHPASTHPPVGLPTDITVAAVDGSQIAPDRHLAARCFLLNLGWCSLTYGSFPSADLASVPSVHARDDEVVIRDEVTGKSERVEGAVLAALRHVKELEAAADLADRSSPDSPTVLLVDGPLTPLSRSQSVYPDFVLHRLVAEGFAGAMDRLRQASAGRPMVVAGYTSRPAYSEVARALSSAPSAATGSPPGSHCGVIDSEIFGRHLPDGHRSALFSTPGLEMEPHLGGHDPACFYLNSGWEIARVELPIWAAEDSELVELLHTALIDQCRRGSGYPTTLTEAHEQAVVTSADRCAFSELLDAALADQGLVGDRPEKVLSKAVRSL